ncbi:hypothetical protein E3E12_02655 [Formicincola oecophyllae]|uniref:Uncharacterized protein n=1 Tax=Formicincola oecophyllae TaxID=2558361 RepID=A0A4Y6UAY0_9PROT|nr:hypothetical protein [Formicincola oecophyllae]QDH13285.1 hypothetical protein E3E12_02655 [Formicincola oecophyllae]
MSDQTRFDDLFDTTLLNGRGEPTKAQARFIARDKQSPAVTFSVGGKAIVENLPLEQLQPTISYGDGMKSLSLGQGAEDFPWAITSDEAAHIVDRARKIEKRAH